VPFGPSAARGARRRAAHAGLARQIDVLPTVLAVLGSSARRGPPGRVLVDRRGPPADETMMETQLRRARR